MTRAAEIRSCKNDYPDWTHQQVADYLGCKRPAVTRALKGWTPPAPPPPPSKAAIIDWQRERLDNLRWLASVRNDTIIASREQIAAARAIIAMLPPPPPEAASNETVMPDKAV